jgi:hypothetical protein
MKLADLLIILFIVLAIALTSCNVNAQDVEVPRTWLTVTCHVPNKDPLKWYFDDLRFNPCYTNIICDYKPIVKKLPNGDWEIVFSSDLPGMEKLP